MRWRADAPAATGRRRKRRSPGCAAYGARGLQGHATTTAIRLPRAPTRTAPRARAAKSAPRSRWLSMPRRCSRWLSAPPLPYRSRPLASAQTGTSPQGAHSDLPARSASAASRWRWARTVITTWRLSLKSLFLAAVAGRDPFPSRRGAPDGPERPIRARRSPAIPIARCSRTPHAAVSPKLSIGKSECDVRGRFPRGHSTLLNGEESRARTPGPAPVPAACPTPRRCPCLPMVTKLRRCSNCWHAAHSGPTNRQCASPC